MAFHLAPILAPDPLLLAIAVAIDLAIGDPAYPWHPVRLIGRMLGSVERALRRAGADGYAGGIALFLILASVWAGGLSVALLLTLSFQSWLAWTLHLFLVYSLLALGDLLHHGWRIERAVRAGDLERARMAVAQLVGRDTDRMDGAACRRAAVESLSESLTDGFTSPLMWYVVGGLPALILFKVVSTMDSMVGFKTAAYLRFGWCGARLDDVMNFMPARFTWLLLALVGTVLPRCSGRKALTVGLRQHAILPGPNSGWSEAATAGGIQRRLVGPIWMRGELVTELWIGEETDPALETASDFNRAAVLITVAGLAAAAASVAVLRY